MLAFVGGAARTNPVGSPASAGAARLGYLRPLDGLRGVAVAAVVTYHLVPSALPGGFLGVDAFFVLSGFLITSLLVAELSATGRIDLRQFYLRRLRRLTPALLVVLAALGVYAAIWAAPAELARLREHGLWTLGWMANWKSVADGTTYTDLVAGESLLRHMWSLAIEEQFYVVFPLVVAAAVLVAARRHTHRIRLALGVAAALGAVASTVWMAVVASSGPDGITRAYFGTDTRLHGLLIGVVLGVVLVGRPPRDGPSARVLTVAALPAVAGFVVLLALAGEGDAWMFRGVFLPLRF